MRTYRVGIVGSGFGVKAHLPALIAHPRFEVVALASPHSAEAIAAARGIPHNFKSCAEMVNGCDLDAVVIASPPFAHEDDALAAMAAGKHVLCEKPLALNVGQAQRMLEASKRAGTACFCLRQELLVERRKCDTWGQAPSHTACERRGRGVERNRLKLTIGAG